MQPRPPCNPQSIADDKVANFTLKVIAAHDPAQPLHMYVAWHNVHEPLEVPQAQLDRFNFVFDNCTSMDGGVAGGKNNTCSSGEHGPLVTGGDGAKECCFRQFYSAMVSYVDMHVGQVVDALKAKGMWDNTLMVVSSDNGEFAVRPPTAAQPPTLHAPRLAASAHR